MKKITFLIPLLTAVLLIPGMAFADQAYDRLSDEEKIDKNGQRAKQILVEIGGYDQFKKAIESSEKTSLKNEINELNEKMSELGIMTLEEFNDPVQRMQFYLDHPEIIQEDDDTHHVSWTPVSHSCNCNTMKAKMGYHYPFAWWSYDAYLQPTTWQILYPNIDYYFNNDNISHEHSWIEPFIKVYASQSGTYRINGFASVDDSPAYDEEISENRFFSRNVVKTFDFPRYESGIEEDTYVWGTTQ